MNKGLINVITTFVPSSESRRCLRRRLVRASYPVLRICNHGRKERIWAPTYNGGDYSTEEPLLYNAEGRPIRTFYTRDFVACHNSAYDGDRFYMDRYNFALKNHLYVQGELLHTVGHPDRRYGAMFESEGIAPDDYRLFDRHRGLEQDFDLIFTYSSRLLASVSNARFVPLSAGIKLDFSQPDMGLNLLEGTAELHLRKSKMVSILSSAKRMCPLHDLRINVARRLHRQGLADGFGGFDRGLGFVRAYDTLADYRFSVVFENMIDDCFFTEKITNCFACQTIPIYVGARDIGKFFNPDGIIQVPVESASEIERICSRLTCEQYEERLAAVLDNYRRALNYRHPLTWMLENFIEAGNA